MRSRAEEQALVERILAGERDLFSELVNRDDVRFRSWVTRLLGSQADAEEVVQDALLRAFRSLKLFRGDSLFRTWLYRIVLNETRMHVRRKKLRPGYSGGSLCELSKVPEAVLAGPSVLDSMLQKEFDLEVQKALAALPAKDQGVLRMRFEQEKSVADTAQHFNLTVAAVKTRQHRGCNKLRQKLLYSLSSETNQESGRHTRQTL